MDREKRIRQRIKEHYDEVCSLGFEVVAIFLQGSQNYNCDEYTDEYQSDIDTKCIDDCQNIFNKLYEEKDI
jgi:uncharacterized protein YggL (DUF469 family)